MFREELVAEINRMKKAIAKAQEGLGGAPEGSLLVDVIKGKPRYYCRSNPKDKKGTYLGKKDEVIVRRLAQKEYDGKLLRVATRQKAVLERALAAYDKGADAGRQLAKARGGDPLARVYEGLPAERRRLVEPYAVGDEEYARRWLAVEYVSNGHVFGVDGFYAQSGIRVRSKSEVIIADQLDVAGVPYRYEQPLFIGGYSAVYPDFTVLNKRTREEFVWEHLGGMDDPEYRQSALKKLNRYAAAGYVPGKGLLVTMETAAVPLDTRVVKATIEGFLV